METFVTGFGLPGAVILALVGVLLWVVRRIVRGQLVDVRYLQEERERTALERARGDNLEKANDKLTDVLREVLVDKDLGLHLLTSVRTQARTNGGDEQ